MEQNFWEADSWSDCEEIPGILWNPKLQYWARNTGPCLELSELSPRPPVLFFCVI
jgi:hypothetical protein